MKKISQPKTNVKKFAKESQRSAADCDHIKCKLCQY